MEKARADIEELRGDAEAVMDPDQADGIMAEVAKNTKGGFLLNWILMFVSFLSS